MNVGQKNTNGVSSTQVVYQGTMYQNQPVRNNSDTLGNASLMNKQMVNNQSANSSGVINSTLNVSGGNTNSIPANTNVPMNSSPSGIVNSNKIVYNNSSINVE